MAIELTQMTAAHRESILRESTLVSGHTWPAEEN